VTTRDRRLTRVPGGVGTGGYLAPEQAMGLAGPDPRQDLYAAGVVAVEALTGRRPPPTDNPPVGGELGGLLASLVHPDAAHRPASAADALRRLRGLGVPSGAPWQGGPEAPDVVDLLGDPRPPVPWVGRRVPAYAWTVPAVFAGSGLAGSAATWLVLR
jgi:serine/threonine-protein kinase